MHKLLQSACVALIALAAGCSDFAPDAQSGKPIGQPPATPAPGTPQPVQTINCTTWGVDRTSAVDALPGGIWQGTFTNCAEQSQQELVTAFVSEDGRFRIMAAGEHLLAGILQTDGDVLTGHGVDFAPVGTEYFSGPTTSLFIAGRIAERDALVARWGTEWGAYGYFDFTYVPGSYERATPLADLAGVWPLAANYAGSPVEGVWTIEPDGRFSGQDDQGCLQEGQFSLIDEAYSLVAVRLTVTACALAGSYSGLAQREDLVDWWEKAIMVSVDDGSRVLRIGLAIERP